MLVRKTFQGWDVTAIAVASDCAVFCEGRLCKFFDGSLPNIGSDQHFEIAWMLLTVQRQCYKNIPLFCHVAALFTSYRPAKVSIVKINHSIKLMPLVPLSHSCADAFKHTSDSITFSHPLLGLCKTVLGLTLTPFLPVKPETS